jgi:hypothetical protein
MIENRLVKLLESAKLLSKPEERSADYIEREEKTLAN